jgi:hypothetical protein
VTLFAFLLLRLRFVVAIAAAAPYVLAFVFFTLTSGQSGAIFELFLLRAGVFSAAAATYALETGTRHVFYQGLVIADQQRDLEKERDNRIGSYATCCRRRSSVGSAKARVRSPMASR